MLSVIFKLHMIEKHETIVDMIIAIKLEAFAIIKQLNEIGNVSVDLSQHIYKIIV